MPIPLGILASARSGAVTFPTPFFWIDAGNTASYNTGSNWLDISPNNVTGYFAWGSASYQAADAGGAMAFVPNSALIYGTLLSGPTNLASGDFTISLWIKPAATQDSAIFEKGYSASTGGWMIWLVSNQLRFYSRKAARVAVSVTSGVWQHVVYTFNATSGVITAYVNGVSTATGSMTNPTDMSGLAHLIVGQYATSQWYSGRMTEARMWSTAWNATDVGALFTATRTRHGV